MRKYPTKTCSDCGNKIWEGGSRCIPCFIKSRTTPPEKRFWKYVKKTPTCWIWKGYRSKDGYGIFALGNRANIKSHRFSWIIHNGPIPKGSEVLHDCPGGDNPSCVNPSHLWSGTQSANMKDCVSKNRYNHVLFPEEVKEIRRSYKFRKVPFNILARRFGVCFQSIANVIYRKTWKHIH